MPLRRPEKRRKIKGCYREPKKAESYVEEMRNQLFEVLDGWKEDERSFVYQLVGEAGISKMISSAYASGSPFLAGARNHKLG